MTEVASLLGVPESLNVIAVVPFGYPTQVRTRGKKRRKNLSQIAHSGRFSQQFS